MIKSVRRAGVLMAVLASVALGQARGPFAELEAAVDAFDLAKLPPHPRMVLTPPEMTRVRAVAQSEWGRTYWDLIRTYVDEGRAKQPPADPPGYPDGKWNVTDWRRIVAVGDEYQTRILAASFAAVVTQDAEDIAEAKRWTLAAAGLDPLGMTGMKKGVDHPARDIPHAMALSYDWLFDHFSADERAVIRRSLTERGRGLYEYLKPFRGDSWNNHPWFQTSGMVDAALAIVDEVPEADAWWRYGSKLYLTEFLPKGGKDGDWHEGTHYVSYTLLFVYQWADALKTATGIDAYGIPWLQKVGLFSLYIAPPAGAGIQFGDNNFTPPNLLDKYCAYQSARVTRSGVMQWYGDQIPVPEERQGLVRHAIAILIARDAGIAPEPPGDDLPLGVWYRDSGWAVMRTDLSRSDDVQFALKSGKWHGSARSRGHDQPDQNGFLLNYGLEPLALDSGYYDYYGSPHHNGWTFTGKAHNTILVDRKEQLVGKDGQIVAFVSDREGIDFVEAEAAGAYETGLLESWRRQVVFLRPDVFFVRDVVKPTRPAAVSWLLHGPNQFTIDGQKLQVANGKATLAAEMIQPADLKLEQWGGFPEDAQPERKKEGQWPDQWHLSMTTPAAVEEGRFAFVMRPGPAGTTLPLVRREPSADKRVETYSVTDARGPIARMHFLAERERIELGDWVVNARLMVEGTGGRMPLMASGARHLAQGERLWWQSGAAADISGIRDERGWRRLSVRLDDRCVVRLAVPPGATLAVDGAHDAIVTYDRAGGIASLALDKGSHILRIE